MFYPVLNKLLIFKINYSKSKMKKTNIFHEKMELFKVNFIG